MVRLAGLKLTYNFETINHTHPPVYLRLARITGGWFTGMEHGTPGRASFPASLAIVIVARSVQQSAAGEDSIRETNRVAS